MKAIIEKWDDPNEVVPGLQVLANKVTGVIPKSKMKNLVIMSGYLNAIDKSKDTNSLNANVSSFEYSMHYLKIENPFYSGFVHDGFGVYDRQTNERLIFVECETDIDE